MRILLYRFVYSLLLSAVVLIPMASSGVVAENEQDNPAKNQFLIAYNSISLGDWLTRQNMIEEAVDLYEEALGLLVQMGKDYPEWQPRLLAFRINYCKTQLAKLKTVSPVPDKSPKTLSAVDIEKPKQEAKAKPTGSTDLVKKVPESLRYPAMIQSAAQLERAGKLKNAIKIYTNIATEQPGNTDALKGVVRCYLRMGLIDKARTALQAGITEPVSDADLHMLMALVECYSQQFDKAIQLLRLSLEENPRNANAYVAMGVAQMRMGKIRVASEQMRRALSLNSKLNEAYYNLAWITLKKNPTNIPVARVHYQNALKYGAAPDPVLGNFLL